MIMNRKKRPAGYLRQLLVVSEFIIIGFFFCSCGKNGDNGSTSVNAEPVGKNQSAAYMLELTSSDEFDQLLNENQIVLVDFYADWCGPCHMLKPTIKEIAVEYDGKIKVVSVDIDKFNSLARRFKINSIPDIKIFDNAKLENSFLGVQPKESYTRVLNKLVDN